ncbi:WD40 repeat-like protein [Cryphonectria parasitica EP155]|uniref:WD40 repeat-like protein n=1 Tax=Cryphonectria parasitica (strain ATCC 38755 / EP155) TaxID=660469 RepID=A0A9P4XWA2_CRYP1|nr:WD40 repeat-like protein [Cryphonectria parasitica EP155]KAF3761745.1 WD40 repeat-like protein [Cryphonectria parasitica EP155]
MKVTTPGLVPVYTVSGASTARPLPDWLARRRKRSLKNDPEYSNRVELLQDFEFEEASACVRVSGDGQWIMSTGTYKPQIHVHDLNQLSLSWARHTTSLNQSFVILSPDASKSLHLQTDRKLEFHTLGGCHHEIRLPRYGRDLIYDRNSTEALVAAAGVGPNRTGEVFRLNLEHGRFMKSYEVDVGGDDGLETGLQGSIEAGCVNAAAIAENTHNLLAFGTSKGSVELIDPRVRSRVAVLEGLEGEVTSLDFNPYTGLSLVTGTSQGVCSVFDLRRPVPLLRKEQGFGFGIKNIIHLKTASQERKILSADKKIIKIWDDTTGEAWTSIEPITDLNFVQWVKDTGTLVTANEGKQQHVFHIPALGSAPKWCGFLDNMVEEMTEEVRTDTYDNYKFLTKPELKSLSLDHLVGTAMLRPYMHGYFVDTKLYEQARLVANPYVYEDERQKRVQEKVEKERASRIRGMKKVKVNQRLADKILARQERRDKVDVNAGVLGDNRFAKLFEDEEFVVDETSREFKIINPSTNVEAPTEAAEITPNQKPFEDDSELEQDDASDGDEPIRKSSTGVSMRVSTSGQGGTARDTVLGSRVQKSGRTGKARQGDVVGERSVSFMPEKKKKNRPEQPAVDNKRSAARRSASTNTFRKL